MKKILYLLFISSITVALLQGISLKDVINKSIKEDIRDKNFSVQRKIDILNGEIAKRERLFKLNIRGSYLFKSDNMEIVFPPTVISPALTIPGKTMVGGVKNNFDLNLSIVQPVYSGNIISNNIKLKDNEVKLTENKRLISAFEIADSIKTTYFTYLIISEELKTTGALLKELELHRRKLQNLYSEKLIGKVALLETDIKINEIRLILISLKDKSDKEKHIFKYLTGTDIKNIDRDYSEKIFSLDKSLEFFKHNHPILLNIKLNRDKLKINKDIIQGAYLPQINGFFELHYGKPGIDFFKAEWSPYIQAGIGISYNIFDWNKKNKRLSTMNYLLEKLYNKREDLIRITIKNLNILYSTKSNLQRKEENLTALLGYSNEIKDIKSKLFIENQISNLDYIGFLQRLKRYRTEKIKNKYNIELIKVKINTIIGK
jgi:outer membrane protein TolC